MNNLLSTSLSVAVPLWIEEIKQGYIPYITPKEAADIIVEKGDNLLFRSKKKDVTAELFNILAQFIAIMSFIPGGVTAFDIHWETKLDDLEDWVIDRLNKYIEEGKYE